MSAESLNPVRGIRGMAVAPHALASQSALAVLREGGNAVEAMIAAAATIAVGLSAHEQHRRRRLLADLARRAKRPSASRRAARRRRAATIDFYRARGLQRHSVSRAARGEHGGRHGVRLGRWRIAGRRDALGGTPAARAPAGGRDRLRARRHAGHAQPGATARAPSATNSKRVPGFAETFLPDGARAAPPASASCSRASPRRSSSSRDAGLDDFYRGDLARSIAARPARARQPARAGRPGTPSRARCARRWRSTHSLGTVYNMPPPTQGLVSLLILGMLDRVLDATTWTRSGPSTCTRASRRPSSPSPCATSTSPTPTTWRSIRRRCSRPTRSTRWPRAFRCQRAAPWGQGLGPADTVWMGVDRRRRRGGQLHPEHLSRVRQRHRAAGVGHQLAEPRLQLLARSAARNPLTPGRKPFHTLNPGARALRRRPHDGLRQHGRRRPAAIAKRGVHAYRATSAGIRRRRSMRRAGCSAAPGGRPATRSSSKRAFRRTPSTRCAPRPRSRLLRPYDETMGHAGAIVRHPDGCLEAGYDPRSDGAAAGW